MGEGCGDMGICSIEGKVGRMRRFDVTSFCEMFNPDDRSKNMEMQ